MAAEEESASVLDSARVSEVVSTKGELVDVSASLPILDVFELLEEKNLVSVPVYGRPGSWVGAGGVDIIVNDKQYIGIISILDLVSYVFLSSTSPETASVDEAKLLRALQRPVSSAVGSTDESLSLWVENADKSIMSAMEQFSKGVHRALVLPAATLDGFSVVSNQVKLLTQTDVVVFLMQKEIESHSLRHLFGTPLRLLHRPVGKRDLVSVAYTDGLITALHTALQLNVHGVAVIDAKGKMCSVLSVSDLRGIVSAQLPKMHSVTVGDFLRHKSRGLLPVPLTCSAHSTLREIMKSMVECRFHRIWLVGAGGDPIDVISFTDIISIIWNSERSVRDSSLSPPGLDAGI